MPGSRIATRSPSPAVSPAADARGWREPELARYTSRMRRRLVLALALGSAACGGSSTVTHTPKWAEATTAAPSKPRAACIPQLDEDMTITAASASGTSVQYCVGSEQPECFAFDTKARQLSRLATKPAPRNDAAAYVLTIEPTLDVCASTQCKSLAPKVLAGMSTIRAATNATGSIAVVLLGDAPSGKGYAEIWDVPRTKRVTSFKYARGELRCGDVAMLGDSIYLAASACKQPTARAALYTTKGRKIANVGGADFGVYGHARVQVDATTWAFLEENARQVAVQDVVKGKLKKAIPLTSLFVGDGAQMGNPGESAIVKLDSGMLVVIAGAPATGNLALVDPANGAVEIVRPPSC